MDEDLRTYANLLWADAVLKERDAATARAEMAEAAIKRVRALADQWAKTQRWTLSDAGIPAAVVLAALDGPVDTEGEPSG